MGFPKPFLKWDEKTFFLEKIVQVYTEFGCEKIIVVTNSEVLNFYHEENYCFLEDTGIIINPHPEQPRFVSVKMGIEKLQSDYCFIQNTDNPFVSLALLQLLFDQRNPLKHVVPVCNGKSGHPILLNRKICNYITNLQGNDMILKDELKRFDRIAVEAGDDKIHCNINTPDDYFRQGFIC